MKRARATLYQSHLRDSHAKKKSSDITTGFRVFSPRVVSAARFPPNAPSSLRCRRGCAGARVLVTLIYEMIRRDVGDEFRCRNVGRKQEYPPISDEFVDLTVFAGTKFAFLEKTLQCHKQGSVELLLTIHYQVIDDARRRTDVDEYHKFFCCKISFKIGIAFESISTINGTLASLPSTRSDCQEAAATVGRPVFEKRSRTPV